MQRDPKRYAKRPKEMQRDHPTVPVEYLFSRLYPRSLFDGSAAHCNTLQHTATLICKETYEKESEDQVICKETHQKETEGRDVKINIQRALLDESVPT